MNIGYLYAKVALPLPVYQTFDYLIPISLHNKIQVGHAVYVPFRKQTLLGFVISIAHVTEIEPSQIKPITEYISEDRFFNDTMLRFYQWIAQYYFHPIGQVIATAFPPLQQKKKAVTRYIININHNDNDTDRSHLLKDEDIQLYNILKKSRSGSRISSLQKKTGYTKKNVKKILHHLIDNNFVAEHIHYPDLVPDESNDFESITENKEKLSDSIEHRIIPNIHQEIAISKLCQAIDKKKYQPFLLNGITGSGKTIVYLKVIETVLKEQRSALILVPEIGLTPQLAQRFQNYFGNNVYLVHSGLSPKERWKRFSTISKSLSSVVIGTRSAVFAPIQNLGIIVVDEENDTSYKQEEGLKYHGRDLAFVRAKQENAVLVLGSATPSLETLLKVQNGSITELTLPERPQNVVLPDVIIVDMQNEEGVNKNNSFFSKQLKVAIASSLNREEQVILFLNRRGYYRLRFCKSCHYQFSCPFCSITLVYHKNGNCLKCHYCGFIAFPSDVCPKCNTQSIVEYGFGTERIVHELQNSYPDARIIRLDRDTVSHGVQIDTMLQNFKEHKADILVGTQMVTKGHDFHLVTCVGVLMADTALMFPDFRAGEYAFSQLTQIIGRSGRGQKPGSVIVQTYTPEHYVIQMAAKHDRQGFFSQELKERKIAGYPPFSRIAFLRISGKSQKDTEKFAFSLKALMFHTNDNETLVRIKGPAEAPMAWLKSYYRIHFLIQAQKAAYLSSFLSSFLPKVYQLIPAGIRFSVDVDPTSML